jgi:hypothetical protein
VVKLHVRSRLRRTANANARKERGGSRDMFIMHQPTGDVGCAVYFQAAVPFLSMSMLTLCHAIATICHTSGDRM